MSCDGEYAKCWTASTPKARKAHRCCECGGVIKPGEKYHRFAGIWDYPATYKTCWDCDELRNQVSKGRHWDDVPDLTTLFEDIEASREPAHVIRIYEIVNKRCKRVPLWIREGYLEAMKATA